MSKSQNTASNSSFVSIWKPRSCSGLPDTDKHEEDQTHAIDIETLRAIKGIVLAIKRRIDSEANVENLPSQVPAEIQAAQKLLSRIAAKIITKARRTTDEKQRAYKPDSSFD